MREVNIKRKTKETDIELTLNLDGSGKNEINTGCGFLDHMLTLFAKHGRFDLTVKCIGDTFVDYHHTVEDIGICLGLAFNKALGDMKGIYRYGHTVIPMDEALILTAVDISGRAFLSFKAKMPARRVGNFDTELVQEFFYAFIRNANITLHIVRMDGTNTHHIIEGIFKSFARTMAHAVKINEKYKDEIPSTKGVL